MHCTKQVVSSNYKIKLTLWFKNSEIQFASLKRQSQTTNDFLDILGKTYYSVHGKKITNPQTHILPNLFTSKELEKKPQVKGKIINLSVLHCQDQPKINKPKGFAKTASKLESGKL